MASKKRISLDVPAELADAFRDVASQYVHSKRQGEVLAAAIGMFLEADPHRQAEMIKRVLNAQIDQGMAGLIRDIQARQARGVRPDDSDAGEDRDAVAGDSAVDAADGFGIKPLAPAPDAVRSSAKRPAAGGGESKRSSA